MRIVAAAAVALACSAAVPSLAGSQGAAKARIVGDVLVCNAPGRCFTRAFEVSAIDAAGEVAAHTTTSGSHNRYRQRVPAGEYSLLATSEGLRCTGSATAAARRTVKVNITCPVP